jgi:uncharacterized phiE125 gp8 family phage protein
MQHHVTVQTAPAVEPVSLAQAQAHLRVSGSADSDLITTLITVARKYVENSIGRALITQTLDLYLDSWPTGDEIRLPRPNLQGVTSVIYLDDDDTETEFSSSSYHVITSGIFGRIVLKDGQTWPDDSDLKTAAGIRIRYVAGYGDAAADVPETLRQAMLLMIGHWYEHREEVQDVAEPFTVPFGAKALLDMERVTWT